MKIQVITVSSRLPHWLKELSEEYSTKISRWVPFEVKNLKSPNLNRDARAAKIAEESKLLLKATKADDFVILCDEQGQTFNSEKFAQRLENILGGGKKRIIILIGGAFGVDPTVARRADLSLKMSDFVLNHYLALAVIEEQVYRAMTLIKNVSYHNAREEF